MKSRINKELAAEIRNKLQTIKTALELLKTGKKIPKAYINKTLKDLEKVEEIVSVEFITVYKIQEMRGFLEGMDTHIEREKDRI